MPAPRQHRRTRTDRASAAGDDARARILEAAFELIADKGYRGTSIAQVAARAGISQSGLLHHFPTKEAMLIAVLQYRFELDSDLFERNDAVLSGWAAFDGGVELARRNADRPEMVRMFVTLCAEAMDPDHPAHQWIQNHYRMIERQLTEAVEAGIADGSMRPDIPTSTLVHLTISIMDGLQLQWLAGEGQLDMAAEFAAFVGHLKRTWAAGGNWAVGEST
jgi:AcrR family transcriptional regulator